MKPKHAVEQDVKKAAEKGQGVKNLAQKFEAVSKELADAQKQDKTRRVSVLAKKPAAPVSSQELTHQATKVNYYGLSQRDQALQALRGQTKGTILDISDEKASKDATQRQINLDELVAKRLQDGWDQEERELQRAIRASLS